MAVQAALKSKMFDWLFKKKTSQVNTSSKKSKTLFDISNGQSVKVEGIQGEDSDCQRLREMGFCESATVQKIAESGALICKVCNTRVVISERLAKNIIVQENMDEKKEILLGSLSVGQVGIVKNFIEENDACARLEEMGVTPGEKVEVVRYAPMGDPIEIRVRGYLLSLRKEEANLIQVSI